MVKKGSNIELNCTVERGDRAYNSLAVFWYLNDRAIDWQGQTGPGRGVQVRYHYYYHTYHLPPTNPVIKSPL